MENMKEERIHTGANGFEVWLCHDPDVFTFVEVNMGCFRFHMNQEMLNSMLEGFSKAWYEIHKDNHANCGCSENGVTSRDNPFNRKWGDGP